MYNLAASFVGLLIALMVTVNGILSGHTGDYMSLLIIHIVGVLTISSILMIKKEKLRFKRGIPVYFFCAGAIGVFMVYLNNICVTQIGVSLTLSLGLLGQSIVAVIIDHFGLLGITKQRFIKEKLLGFTLIFIGIFIMIVGG